MQKPRIKSLGDNNPDDGKQHYEYSPYFHGKGKAGLKRFEYLQTCDKLKDKLCKERGIHLIRIRYDRTITPKYLLTRLANEGIDISQAAVKP